MATHAALGILNDGGNAFDAAVAAASTLFVTWPMSCGIGGDAVFVGYDRYRNHPIGVTALGAAPAAASTDLFRSLGHTAIPSRGALSATVPVALRSIAALHARHCSLPLQTLLAPAIRAAADGFAVNRQFHLWTQSNIRHIRTDAWLATTFAPAGRAWPVGTWLRQPETAAVLEMFAARGQAYLTDPNFVHPLVDTSRSRGGLFTAEDFADVPDPDASLLSGPLADAHLFTSPLPTQGYLLLQNCGIYGRSSGGCGQPRSHRIHLLCEAFNQTFAQRLEALGDPAFLGELRWLVDPDNIDRLANRIRLDGKTPCLYRDWYSEGDTTQFVVADEHGNIVSAILSLSLGFGAGIADAKTGMIFNNRLGRSATLNPMHPNVVQPRKRPVNTIHAYLVMRNGQALLAGGSPGGDGQAQWNSDLLTSILLEEIPVTDAVPQARFTYFPGADLFEAEREDALHIERPTQALSDGLTELGYRVVPLAKVKGCLRVIARLGNGWIGVDDGHEDGLTASLH
nr:gamma-glutamyltransferase [uncultured Rhodopila sp.]